MSPAGAGTSKAAHHSFAEAEGMIATWAISWWWRRWPFQRLRHPSQVVLPVPLWRSVPPVLPSNSGRCKDSSAHHGLRTHFRLNIHGLWTFLDRFLRSIAFLEC